MNQWFIEWLMDHDDGFEEKCVALGMSETTCMRMASWAFERKKEAFSDPGAGPNMITIFGAEDAELRTWNIKITR